MSDPIITSFTRPMTESMRDEQGAISFKDNRFNMGFQLIYAEPKEIDLIGLPPEIGSVSVDLIKEDGRIPIQTKPCDKVLSSDVVVQEADQIMCLDLNAD